MSLTAAIVSAALILLPAIGLVAWAWSSMAQVERELRRLCGLGAMHVDLGDPAARDLEARRWPIPG